MARTEACLADLALNLALVDAGECPRRCQFQGRDYVVTFGEKKFEIRREDLPTWHMRLWETLRRLKAGKFWSIAYTEQRAANRKAKPYLVAMECKKNAAKLEAQLAQILSGSKSNSAKDNAHIKTALAQVKARIGRRLAELAHFDLSAVGDEDEQLKALKVEEASLKKLSDWYAANVQGRGTEVDRERTCKALQEVILPINDAVSTPELSADEWEALDQKTLEGEGLDRETLKREALEREALEREALEREETIRLRMELQGSDQESLLKPETSAAFDLKVAELVRRELLEEIQTYERRIKILEHAQAYLRQRDDSINFLVVERDGLQRKCAALRKTYGTADEGVFQLKNAAEIKKDHHDVVYNRRAELLSAPEKKSFSLRKLLSRGAESYTIHGPFQDVLKTYRPPAAKRIKRLQNYDPELRINPRWGRPDVDGAINALPLSRARTAPTAANDAYEIPELTGSDALGKYISGLLEGQSPERISALQSALENFDGASQIPLHELARMARALVKHTHGDIERAVNALEVIRTKPELLSEIVKEHANRMGPFPVRARDLTSPEVTALAAMAEVASQPFGMDTLFAFAPSLRPQGDVRQIRIAAEAMRVQYACISHLMSKKFSAQAIANHLCQGLNDPKNPIIDDLSDELSLHALIAGAALVTDPAASINVKRKHKYAYLAARNGYFDDGPNSEFQFARHRLQKLVTKYINRSVDRINSTNPTGLIRRGFNSVFRTKKSPLDAMLQLGSVDVNIDHQDKEFNKVRCLHDAAQRLSTRYAYLQAANPNSKDAVTLLTRLSVVQQMIRAADKHGWNNSTMWNNFNLKTLSRVARIIEPGANITPYFSKAAYPRGRDIMPAIKSWLRDNLGAEGDTSSEEERNNLDTRLDLLDRLFDRNEVPLPYHAITGDYVYEHIKTLVHQQAPTYSNSFTNGHHHQITVDPSLALSTVGQIIGVPTVTASPNLKFGKANEANIDFGSTTTTAFFRVGVKKRKAWQFGFRVIGTLGALGLAKVQAAVGIDTGKQHARGQEFFWEIQRRPGTDYLRLAANDAKAKAFTEDNTADDWYRRKLESFVDVCKKNQRDRKPMKLEDQIRHGKELFRDLAETDDAWKEPAIVFGIRRSSEEGSTQSISAQIRTSVGAGDLAIRAIVSADAWIGSKRTTIDSTPAQTRTNVGAESQGHGVRLREGIYAGGAHSFITEGDLDASGTITGTIVGSTQSFAARRLDALVVPYFVDGNLNPALTFRYVDFSSPEEFKAYMDARRERWSYACRHDPIQLKALDATLALTLDAMGKGNDRGCERCRLRKGAAAKLTALMRNIAHSKSQENIAMYDAEIEKIYNDDDSWKVDAFGKRGIISASTSSGSGIVLTKGEFTVAAAKQEMYWHLGKPASLQKANALKENVAAAKPQDMTVKESEPVKESDPHQTEDSHRHNIIEKPYEDLTT